MSAVLAERPVAKAARQVVGEPRPLTLDDILGPQWRDLEWRLRSLYHIVDEHGKSIPFEPNDEQLDVVRNLHTRNLILKARQLGFCLDPDTLVLTADLRWIRLADVQPGQELVATDENISGGRGGSRKMRTATVLATRVTVGRAYRMTFDDGRSVVCTGNHRWLTRKVATDASWRMINDGRSSITVGTKVRWITKPWGDSDFEDGWFGGMLDGEGSMAKDCHTAGVNVSQRPGPVWDRLRAYALTRGYSACVESDSAERPSKFGKTPVPKLAFGRMDELFRLMGQTRPTRFIARRWWEGRDLPGKRTGEAWATVVSIEELNTRPMIDLQTTTGTFIAEGFVSHNSTLFEILQLDQSLFNANHTGSVISDTRENGGKLFAKIEHAYAKLPEALREALPLKSLASKSSLEFEHGSGVWVATSARGGTVQFLHISELGKISRRTPQRAAEIVSGGFEAVPQDGIIVVESTAEGAYGEFFDLCDVALKREAENAPETPLDWRLHFYPWFLKAAYRLDPALVIVGDKHTAYFNKLEAELKPKYGPDFRIDPAQRAWWVKKEETLKRNMKREYPATPREAFEQAIEGAIFGDEMTAVREAGRITTVPLDVNFPVNTFWDFGLGARNPIWLHQRIGLQNRWPKYFDDFGKGLGWWWRTLEEFRHAHGDFQWGTHYLPHDADTEILGENVTTKRRILEAAGMRNIVVVPRVALKETAIDLVRQKLPADNWFDREHCAEGIKCLDGYQYEWDDHLGRFKDQPMPNWASHGADAWMQYAQGYQAPADVDRDKRRRRTRNWKTA